jgi:hypothetical protein
MEVTPGGSPSWALTCTIVSFNFDNNPCVYSHTVHDWWTISRALWGRHGLPSTVADLRIALALPSMASAYHFVRFIQGCSSSR